MALVDLIAAGIRGLALLPALYYVAAARAGLSFFKNAADQSGEASSDFTPPVSILKPVRGLDRHAQEYFSGFCRQDYPDYEVLFAVSDASDPALPVLRAIARDHPQCTVRVITDVADVGANSKISKLCRLVREARHDYFVISDSDIAVPPNYLRTVMAQFRSPDVGAVTCLYRGIPEPNVWARLEALSIAADFVPGVLLAIRMEGVRFTMGATMATDRARLAEIGGFEAMADYCADDFELGQRLARHGYRIAIAPCIVGTEASPRGFRGFVEHQIRWATTIRHARPLAWVGRAMFTQGLPWAIAAAVVAPSRTWSAAYVLMYAVTRFSMAWIVSVRGLGDQTVRRWWPLIPLYDAASCLLTIAAFFTNRIVWRGRSFRMRRGRLVPAR